MNTINLGSILRWMRLSMNWPITVFAEKLNVTTGYISHVELGFRNPSWKLTKRAASAVGIPLTFFFFLSEADTIREQYPDVYEAIMKADPKIPAFLHRKEHPVEVQMEQLPLFTEEV